MTGRGTVTGVRVVFIERKRKTGPTPPKSYRGWCNCGWEGPRRDRAYKSEQDVYDHDHQADTAEEETC